MANYKKIVIGTLLLIVVLACLILLKIMSNDKWDYDLQPLEKGAKIVAFGDSLTYGYQLPREDTYPSLLNQELNFKYNIINYGISGNTTSDGLLRFNEMINREKPNLVILGLGGNDILRKVSQNITKKNLNEMIDIAKNNNVQIILLPNPEPKITGFLVGFDDYKLFKEISDEKKVPILKNTFSKWLSKNSYKIDNIHLNKKGYLEVAKDIKKQLLENKVVNN